MNIADRIQSLRKSKGISQEELADKIGVSRQAVSKWESEQSLPDMEKVILVRDCDGSRMYNFCPRAVHRRKQEKGSLLF